MKNQLFFCLLTLTFFSSCRLPLPREIRNHIPRGVEDEKAYVINSLKARANLNDLVSEINVGERDDTKEIDMARAIELRGELSDSSQFNSKGVFFHFPTLIKALMLAKGVDKAEALLLDSRNFDLKKSGFYAVFGRYPNSPREDHPGRLTCYLSFAYKDSSGNPHDIESPLLPTSGTMSSSTIPASQPIMFNFGALCPDKCPTSLRGQ